MNVTTSNINAATLFRYIPAVIEVPPRANQFTLAI
jgi:hypothetical protein